MEFIISNDVVLVVFFLFLMVSDVNFDGMISSVYAFVLLDLDDTTMAVASCNPSMFLPFTHSDLSGGRAPARIDF